MGIFSLNGLFGQMKKSKANEKIDLNKPVENPVLKNASTKFNLSKS